MEGPGLAGISIHALLAESDLKLFCTSKSPIIYFYPRSPCGERPAHSVGFDQPYPHFYPRSPCGERQGVDEVIDFGLTFLSTLSLRRATRVTPLPGKAYLYFYPRSPCGERHFLILPDAQVINISIHALLAESDMP